MDPQYEQIQLDLKACKGVEPPAEALQAGGSWILNSDNVCDWDGEGWDYDPDTGEWTELTDDVSTKDGSSGNTNLIMFGAGAAVLIIVILLTVLVLRRGDDDDGDSGFQSATQGYPGVATVDPMEAYVQQLIAQGYPEETARAYAQQYAAHFQQQAATQQPGYR